MNALDHSPPRLSDMHPDKRKPILEARHVANRDNWLRLHEAAKYTLPERVMRAARNLFIWRK